MAYTGYRLSSHCPRPSYDTLGLTMIAVIAVWERRFLVWVCYVHALSISPSPEVYCYHGIHQGTFGNLKKVGVKTPWQGSLHTHIIFLTPTSGSRRDPRQCTHKTWPMSLAYAQPCSDLSLDTTLFEYLWLFNLIFNSTFYYIWKKKKHLPLKRIRLHGQQKLLLRHWSLLVLLLQSRLY